MRAYMHSRLESVKQTSRRTPATQGRVGRGFCCSALRLTVEKSEYALLRVGAQKAEESFAYLLLHRTHAVQGSVIVVTRALLRLKGLED